MNRADARFDDPVASPDRPEVQGPFSGDPSVAQRQYEALLQQNARPLLAFLAARVHRSDLEDTSQVVWTRIWQRRESFRGGSFRAWMFEIARNYLIDLGRKRRPEALELQYDVADGQTGPLEILLDRERIDRLNRCLDRLDAQLAELVRARLRNESYEDIASRLNLEPQKAHRRFHSAKQQLQDCVSQGES